MMRREGQPCFRLEGDATIYKIILGSAEEQGRWCHLLPADAATLLRETQCECLPIPFSAFPEFAPLFISFSETDVKVSDTIGETGRSME